MRLKPSAEAASLQASVPATCGDETVRDGKRAIQLAERAKAVTGGEPTVHGLMALAAAHAEAGDFKEAATYQRQVIGIVSDDERAEQLERLRLFEGKQPYHGAR